MSSETRTINSNAPAGSPPQRGLLGKLRTGNRGVIEAVQSLGLLTVIAIGCIVLSLATPVFFTRINIENLL